MFMMIYVFKYEHFINEFLNSIRKTNPIRELYVNTLHSINRSQIPRTKTLSIVLSVSQTRPWENKSRYQPDTLDVCHLCLREDILAKLYRNETAQNCF